MPMETDSGASRRKRAYRAGHRAERIALICLALKGYRPLARRYVVRGGEIDLIVRRGATIAFVEVKARRTLAEALDAVTAAKRRRVEKAAATWLAHNPWALSHCLRGDILACRPWRWPSHLPGALPISIGH